MSSLKNKVQLIGRVGQDPVVKVYESNKKRATFSLAINDVYYNDAGERVEFCDWHNIIVWGKLAEIVDKFVNKGKEIAVEGKLVNRSFEDKDGNQRYVTEIAVSELVFLGSK
ncbi:single-stranded DNA-binding protein [Myroides marinus]|uniref:single-stranded DNA-binding protein n=1 Tax=Myroides marinus TaxID=703342 RepID=UPI002577A2C9|nr:single-stranded DNA-binding protein [Myroides marinus]MDM1404365.1 single-stranded DNA-binding protein [Myroides marinus]